MGSKNARLARVAGRMLSRYTSLVRATSRVVVEPADGLQVLRDHHPSIMCFWHGQFLMIPALCPEGLDVRVMVARHTDAEVIGELAARHGFELIRGAGAGTRQRDRGGAVALRRAVDSLDEGWSVAMTADVPPGPARRASAGVVTLARLSARPIIPVAVASSRYRAFDTWSRMTLNMPYSTIGIAIGEPIHVEEGGDEAERERLRAHVESELNRVTRRAYALCGADIARATPDGTDPDLPPAKLGWRLGLYRTVTGMLGPAAPLLLQRRERQGKDDPARRGERLGQSPVARPDGPLLWLHAASVGETMAVLSLIARLHALRPDLNVVLTTVTRTSAQLAADRLGERDIHQYAPIDTPIAMRRFLDHWKPDIVALTESEIWPNLIIESAERAIPIIVVNGRMSERSFNRWRKNRAISRPLFNRIRLVLAQNDDLARRFSQLGARDVRSAGGLKIDAPALPVNATARDVLREAIDGRPLLFAASTHDGEERIVIEALALLRRTRPDILAIIAPRHPDRGKDVAAIAAERGYAARLRSSGELPHASTDVYIADTLGELGTLYELCPIAIIGGSLVDKGGQNPIEAVRGGAAVLTGPFVSNFVDPHRELRRAKASIEVADAQAIAAAVENLLADPARLARLRDAGAGALSRLSGALERTTAAVLQLLPPAGGPPSAP